MARTYRHCFGPYLLLEKRVSSRTMSVTLVKAPPPAWVAVLLEKVEDVMSHCVETAYYPLQGLRCCLQRWCHAGVPLRSK
jgi:hypothetical protein